MEAWWCNIDIEDISVSGFAHSMNVYESVLHSEDLTRVDSSQQGLYGSSSSIHVSDSLVTRVSDNGIVMISKRSSEDLNFEFPRRCSSCRFRL